MSSGPSKVVAGGHILPYRLLSIYHSGQTIRVFHEGRQPMWVLLEPAPHGESACAVFICGEPEEQFGTYYVDADIIVLDELPHPYSPGYSLDGTPLSLEDIKSRLAQYDSIVSDDGNSTSNDDE